MTIQQGISTAKMKEKARNLSKKAEELRQSDRLQAAGNYYTASAHEYAGVVTEHTFPGADKTVSALGELLNAATCYRLVGDTYRVNNRCELGTLLAEDYLNYIDSGEWDENSFVPFRRGAWHEFIGDLRTVAEKEEASNAYEKAIDIYISAGDWEVVYGEKEHLRIASYLRSVRRGLGHDISEDAPEMQGSGTTFSEWVWYKQENLPKYLSQLEAQGSWPTQIDQS